jgi:hypothetical protein
VVVGSDDKTSATAVESEIVMVGFDDEIFSVVVTVVLDSGRLVVVSIDLSVASLTSVGDEIVDSPRIFIDKLNMSNTAQLKFFFVDCITI